MADVGTWRDKSEDELQDALVKLKKEQFNLRFQKANGQLENTSRARDVRRDIARVLTIIGERARHPDAAVTARPARARARKEAAPEAAKPAAKPKRAAKRAKKK